jgi:hypothetical protein
VARPSAAEKSVPALLTELWDLVRAYVKQETVEPVKGLGRVVGWGLAGSLFLAIGLVLLALAGLRALQTETGDTFAGNWSWAPYLITLAGVGLVIAVAARAMGSKRSAHEWH